jgi:hypothetical protein
MRVSKIAAALCAVASLGVVLDSSFAQSTAAQAARPAEGVRVATAAPAAKKPQKFTFIFFWKENNAPTQEMAGALKAAVEQRPERAEWTTVNITDAAQRAVVERYHVERAPMPMVICVAANGAITGAMNRQVTQEAIEKALVTPAMTEAAKAVQEKRIVIVHIQRDARAPLPAGAGQFMADPAFKDRTTAVTFVATDEAEVRFLKEMEIKPEDVADSMVVLLAPPGVLVGKYPATVAKDQLGADLHAAGKCCNDPNCKHNQQNQTQQNQNQKGQ